MVPSRVKFLLEEGVRRVEEREHVTQVREWYEELKQAIRDSGRQEGRLEVCAEAFAKRLARPLTDAEWEVLADRLGRLGNDRLAAVAFTFEGEALAAWLADPAAS